MVPRGLGFGGRPSPNLRGACRTPSAEHLDRQYRTPCKRPASQHPQPAVAVVPDAVTLTIHLARIRAREESGSILLASQINSINIMLWNFYSLENCLAGDV